jgi:hypothetical protein
MRAVLAALDVAAESVSCSMYQNRSGNPPTPAVRMVSPSHPRILTRATMVFNTEVVNGHRDDERTLLANMASKVLFG